MVIVELREKANGKVKLRMGPLTRERAKDLDSITYKKLMGSIGWEFVFSEAADAVANECAATQTVQEGAE